MLIVPGFPILLNTGDTPRRPVATLNPALALHPQRGPAIMRQMLIATAIAAGLVALWAALLPLAA